MLIMSDPSLSSNCCYFVPFVPFQLKFFYYPFRTAGEFVFKEKVILLSEKLLQLRPLSDLVDILMVCLFVVKYSNNNKNRNSNRKMINLLSDEV